MASKKILVVVDPRTEEDQPVLHRAAWLAKRTGSDLELFACDYDANIDAGRVAKVIIPKPGVREQALLRHRRQLENFATALRGQGLKVTVEVAWDWPPVEAIVRRAVAERPWLVATDTLHHNLLQRTLLTNADWELIRDCPLPLLLVKGREIAEKPVVLAAVDPLHVHDEPAALDDAIYRFAAALSESVGGSLHLAHASTPPLGVELPPNVQALVAAEHTKAVASFVETHPVDGDKLHVMRGLAHDCLRQIATDREADFVVMGAIARRGIKKWLIGSTAARVLDRLPCDLVIIKPAELVLPH